MSAAALSAFVPRLAGLRRPAAKLVLLYLAVSHRDEAQNRFVKVSVRQVAAVLNVSATTVQAALDDLEVAGLIGRAGGVISLKFVPQGIDVHSGSRVVHMSARRPVDNSGNAGVKKDAHNVENKPENGRDG